MSATPTTNAPAADSAKAILEQAYKKGLERNRRREVESVEPEGALASLFVSSVSNALFPAKPVISRAAIAVVDSYQAALAAGTPVSGRQWRDTLKQQIMKDNPVLFADSVAGYIAHAACIAAETHKAVGK